MRSRGSGLTRGVLVLWWSLTAVLLTATLVAPPIAASRLYTWATIPFALGPTLAAWLLAWQKRHSIEEGRGWWCFAVAAGAAFLGEVA
jgi:hypothetical protein